MNTRSMCGVCWHAQGLAHPINGSADSLTFLYQLLQQTLTAQVTSTQVNTCPS